MSGSDLPNVSTEVILLTDLFPEEIAEALGVPAFRGRQIFKWLHAKQIFDFDAMSDLPKDLRSSLSERCIPNQLEPTEELASANAEGTRKTLFRLRDGETVESVLIRHPKHTTICLSTQVGCAVKCTFCATGFSGYTRNLSAGEIVEQALHLLADVDLQGRTPNIVFMGMGEPFRNYHATMRATRLLMHKEGLNIGQRKITISTVGEVDGIERFAKEDVQVRLSVSLHAANDTLRSELVPLNRKYPIDRLIQAIRTYLAETDRMITFEWTLLKDANDSEKDADELAALAKSVNAKVNLIPYNPVAELGYEPPSMNRCKAFLARLERAGVKATLRAERGQDINAACGQLRRREAAAT